MWKKLGDELWQRVVVSYKSTLLGILAAAGVVCIDQFTTYLHGLPSFTGSAVAGVVFALGALARSKLQAEVLQLPPKGPPIAFLLVAGSLLLAAPVRAQDAQPGGLLPAAGFCFHDGKVCAQPAVTVVPIVIDFRSGNLSRDIAFGFGYGLVFPKTSLPAGLMPGVDFLGGVQTGGNWIAAVMPRLGEIRFGPVVSHKPGATYCGMGFGAGY